MLLNNRYVASAYRFQAFNNAVFLVEVPKKICNVKSLWVRCSLIKLAFDIKRNEKENKIH